MTLIGLDNYGWYHPILITGTFGESGSQIRIDDPNNNAISLGSPSTTTLDFVDALSDNVKIVYQYSGAPHYAVFLKKSNGSYRFGFFDGAAAYYTPGAEAAAAAYSEAEVDAVFNATASISTWASDNYIRDDVNYDAEWPAAPAGGGGGGEGAAAGDPFITPILC